MPAKHDGQKRRLERSAGRPVFCVDVVRAAAPARRSCPDRAGSGPRQNRGNASEPRPCCPISKAQESLCPAAGSCPRQFPGLGRAAPPGFPARAAADLPLSAPAAPTGSEKPPNPGAARFDSRAGKPAHPWYGCVRLDGRVARKAAPALGRRAARARKPSTARLSPWPPGWRWAVGADRQ